MHLTRQFGDITQIVLPSRSQLSDWLPVIAGLLLIAFFGFGSESSSYYARLIRLLGGGRMLDRASATVSTLYKRAGRTGGTKTGGQSSRSVRSRRCGC